VLEVIPAPTAFQLAFAALAEPWADAALLSAHARPLSAVVAGALAAPKAAILTDHQHTPTVIAQALLEAGLSPDSPCAICENLGSHDQRVIRTKLGCVGEENYASLNVFVVWRGGEEAKTRGEEVPLIASSPQSQRPPMGKSSPLPPGLPDNAFSTSAGQITKREVRLLTLAELALGRGKSSGILGRGAAR
jgi:precorrin-6Y C5,15-methyltransferase (decarboxylating)